MKKLLIALLTILSFALSSDLSAKQPKALIYSHLVPADQRAAFEQAVIQSAARLHIEPDWLMIVMCFETAKSFRPNVRNKYSGAVGLIQFIPSTAKRLGTTANKLAGMTSIQQLVYVEKYFAPYAGRMTDVYDVYLVVFAPAFLGRKPTTILYRADSPDQLGRNRYAWNRVLDDNKDGLITIKDVKRQIRKFVP